MFSQHLQRSVLLYMVKILLDKKEKEAITALFETIDDDRNAKIDVDDITKAYRDKYDILVSDTDINRVSKQVDVSREGEITITEFLLGACSKSTLLTDANLKQVFAFIDAGGNNMISRRELKSFLGVNDDTYIGLIIEEADDDCDGGLNYKEFSNLMMRITRFSGASTTS